MKRIAVLGLALACATEACAQQVIDGSDKDFDTAVVKQVTAAMQPKNSLPRKVIIRKLRKAKTDPTTICGSVTVEDRYGTFPDFKPFVIYADTFYFQDADVCQ